MLSLTYLFGPIEGVHDGVAFVDFNFSNLHFFGGMRVHVSEIVAAYTYVCTLQIIIYHLALVMKADLARLHALGLLQISPPRVYHLHFLLFAAFDRVGLC